MKAVWKYILQIADKQIISMPAGAELLTVTMQQKTPVLYALVNLEATREERIIYCHGTGYRMYGDEGKYLGTVSIAGGNGMFHFFAGDTAHA